MSKSKPLLLGVQFDITRVYSQDEPTKINEIQDGFAQSVVFIDALSTALTALADRLESLGAENSDRYDVAQSVRTLTVFNKVFCKEMQERFDQLLHIAEGKNA